MANWKNILQGGVAIVTFVNQAPFIIAPAFGQQGVQIIQGGAQVSSTNGLPVVLPSNGTADATAPTIGNMIACQAATGEFGTLATNGQLTLVLCGLEGKPVFLPYSVKENMVRGMASTALTTALQLLPPSGSGLKTYIPDVQCGRTDAGTTAITVIFNDTATSVLILPNNGGGGGNNQHFSVPLVTAANATFTFAPSVAIATVVCNAQGYKGS